MRLYLLPILMCAIPSDRTIADVTWYGNFPDAWKSAVNHNYTFVGFTGWPNFTLLTEQYANLGLSFPDENVWTHNASIYGDGAGLWIQSFPAAETTLQFSQDQYWFGMDYGALMQVSLYYDADLVGSQFVFPGGSFGFAGVVSSIPFNRVVLFHGNFHTMNIDNLYFGPPIPAPGALGLLALAALTPRRRRRG